MNATAEKSQTVRKVVAIHTDPVKEELLTALKECALEIAQLRNGRRLTSNEQAALDNARIVIAKHEGL